jgi:histidinol-phosphatase (PHP family)
MPLKGESLASSDWPRVDYHSHNCAVPLETMLVNARAAGLREYGVSEHVFQLDEGHVVLPEEVEEGDRFPRAWYVQTVRDAAASSVDLAIKLGLEVDFVPERHTQIMAVTEGIEWDYLIGSVHVVDTADIFARADTEIEEGERRWRRYFELTAEAIETGDFDVISHPVRYAISNPHLPAEFDRLLEQVAAFALLHGVALELNGDDMARTPQLVERLAQACGRAGCVVSLGSDAHRAHEVGQGLRQASAYAAAAHVPGVVSFQQRDRRVIPL